MAQEDSLEPHSVRALGVAVLTAGVVFGLPSAWGDENPALEAPTPRLAGRWKLNPELSEDARAKMREAREAWPGDGSGGGRGGASGAGGGERGWAAGGTQGPAWAPAPRHGLPAGRWLPQAERVREARVRPRGGRDRALTRRREAHDPPDLGAQPDERSTRPGPPRDAPRGRGGRLRGRGGGPGRERRRAQQPAPPARRPPLLRHHQDRRPLRRGAAARRLSSALGDGLPRRPSTRDQGRGAGKSGHLQGLRAQTAPDRGAREQPRPP